tara:strand:+ start:1263 stop:2414 length:1152 start_codon:yes stop_codon:yes gene_type:complete
MLFELTNKRPPVSATGIASINQAGIVFNPSPGRAGYVRYRWSDFTAKGLEMLLSQMPLERAFLQKDATTKVQLIDLIRTEITLKIPKQHPRVEPPVKPRVEPPVKPRVEPPVKPRVEINTGPRVLALSAPVGVAAIQNNAPNEASNPIREFPKILRKENIETNDNSVDEFNIVPGPIIPMPPATRLGSENWLNFSGMILLLSFISLSAYAGYEIALFRHRPEKIVCALSALFPVITPLVVLLLPDPAEARAEKIAEENDRYIIHPSTSSGNDPGLTEFSKNETQLPVSEDDVASESTPVAVERYSSDNTHFSAQFFSEHLSRFYQSAPSQGETLYIQTAEHIIPVHHISALEPESLNVVYASESEWLEQTLEYSRIEEIRVES